MKKKGRRGKEKKKKRGRKNTSLACHRLRAVVARGSLRAVAAHGRFFSRARRRSVSPRGETDRGDTTYVLTYVPRQGTAQVLNKWAKQAPSLERGLGVHLDPDIKRPKHLPGSNRAGASQITGFRSNRTKSTNVHL
ncbi:hypothetical protein GW17_00017245 [Ensete ventricosum]|nr:hypothetical protein GW17_00017245 [Ensete ventricosum]RZR88517.1 hypothetical protein BHM03_00016109 [Ensete ventricosum]